MKDSINFYYNLQLAEVENWADVYRFQIAQENYYFVPVKRTQNELKDILEISFELKKRNIPVHDILKNKYGNFVTTVYNENYILLKPIGDPTEEYDILDILKLNRYLVLNSNKLKLYRNSWANLWANKLDYFEYQIHELGKNKKLVLDTFSYYLGLGENAISYVSLTNSKYQISDLDKITLSHRRIGYPNYKINFLNPLSFIFDLEIRDIAEYLKSAFFKDEDAFLILQQTLRRTRFSIYSYHLLYARLLYPTYYFDLYEKVMNDKENEDILIPLVKKADLYEQFLKKAYYEISNYVTLERIDWLLKEK